MKAEVQRNKETGEFSCVVGEAVLLKGSTSAKIKRAYDMAEAINTGGKPTVTTQGSGDKREFSVQIGDFVVFSGDGAIKAYRELDKLEAALLDGLVMIENPEDAGSAGLAQEMGGVHAGSAPHDAPELGDGDTRHKAEGPF